MLISGNYYILNVEYRYYQDSSEMIVRGGISDLLLDLLDITQSLLLCVGVQVRVVIFVLKNIQCLIEPSLVVFKSKE
jgi:hypothetical protein